MIAKGQTGCKSSRSGSGGDEKRLAHLRRTRRRVSRMTGAFEVRGGGLGRRKGLDVVGSKVSRAAAGGSLSLADLGAGPSLRIFHGSTESAWVCVDLR